MKTRLIAQMTLSAFEMKWCDEASSWDENAVRNVWVCIPSTDDQIDIKQFHAFQIEKNELNN